ncbi:MAG: tRNA pseudouridine(38-40) synthase TruA [Oscillospiraceae bacterium]|nr:tRNA pseudouridine(38-40) synthase TruA [Oscillospiraceae bacterium]
MRNIKVIMSYKGTNYHGFQRQDNAITVQEVIESRLSKLIGLGVTINGCSRTDTGVHANEYCFNFFTDSPIPCANLLYAANCMMPDDIVFLSCEETPSDFHARFDCIAKEYLYLIRNAPAKDPFSGDKALFYPYPLDIDKLSRAALNFEGAHDFTSFCGSAGLKNQENRVRTIEYCAVKKCNDENYVKILVKGDGFLYNMIRIIAGTLIFINEGKIAEKAVPGIIAAKDRTKAGKTAPPQGLYLNKVFY